MDDLPFASFLRTSHASKDEARVHRTMVSGIQTTDITPRMQAQLSRLVDSLGIQGPVPRSRLGSTMVRNLSFLRLPTRDTRAALKGG